MFHRPCSISIDSPAQSESGCAHWRTALATGLFLFTAIPAFPQGLWQWLYHHDAQVITATDTTRAGALLRTPSPADPVYYVAKDFGFREFGAPMPGDKLPVRQDMRRMIVRVLATAGYLPADVGHQPTQIIIFAWGTLNREIMPNPYGQDLPDIQLNFVQELRFLGGDKLGLDSEYLDDWMVPRMPGLTCMYFDAKGIRRVATEDLYAAALAGYEFPVQQPKHPKLLWRTTIACPAAGLAMDDTLPPMLVIAAPYIGRETKGPVWVNASDKFKPVVQIGNPKVEECLDSGQLPVYEAKVARAKTGRDGK